MTTDAANYQFPEDSPHVSGDRGTAALAVRQDTPASLVDADGDYTLLQVDASGNLRTTGLVVASFSGGTLTNGAETAVGAAAVQVIAANASRKKLIVQNTGLGDVRVGVSGVTATSGVRLIRNGSIIFDMPDCPTQAIFAIRDGAVSSTVLAQEVS